MGNRVSQWYVKAPIDDADALSRVSKIREATSELKSSKQALDADLIMAVAEWTPTVLMSLASRSASGAAPYNLMVTNVPGPRDPLYLLGARLESMYSQVPIADSTALGVAIVSYDGKFCWGFNADYELLPDLDVFADAVESAFAELAEAAGVGIADAPCGRRLDIEPDRHRLEDEPWLRVRNSRARSTHLRLWPEDRRVLRRRPDLVGRLLGCRVHEGSFLVRQHRLGELASLGDGCAQFRCQPDELSDLHRRIVGRSRRSDGGRTLRGG